MMVTFALHDRADPKHDLGRREMDGVPAVDDHVEIKDVEYVVVSRRWKLQRLGTTVTVFLRALIEQAG